MDPNVYEAAETSKKFKVFRTPVDLCGLKAMRGYAERSGGRGNHMFNPTENLMSRI